MIRIECRFHPIDVEPREFHEVQYRRQRLSTLIKNHAPQFNGVVVWVNSNLIPEDDISKYKCRDNDRVVITPKLTFGGLGAAFAATLAGKATLLQTLHVLAFQAVLGAALSYGINALTVKTPSTKTAPGVKQNYTWSEGTTATDGLPMMLPFGKVPLCGNIISSYTDYVGDDELRYMLLSHGHGNYEGPIADSMVLNGQPKANYTGVTIQTKYGTADQTAATAFTSLVNEYWINRTITNAAGAVTLTTRGGDFDSIELLFEWQARSVAKSGDYRHRSCGIKIEMRIKDDVGGFGWSILAEYGLDNYTDDIKRTKFVNTGTYTGGAAVAVSNGTDYDIRVTKTSADTSGRGLESLVWKYTHEVIATGFTYPGQPLTAISAVATAELSGGMDIKEVWETSIVNKVDTTIAYSNNPADIIHFLLTLPLITGSGTGPDPYVIDSYRGQAPATISNYAALLADLVLLATRCDEPVSTAEGGTVARYQFNGVFADSTDQWEAINTVCASCDCKLVPRGNGFKLLIHENWVGDPVALYSPGNMIAGSFVEEEVSDLDKKGKFEMTILDSNADFAEALIPLYDSSAGHAAKVETIGGNGITNRTQAARELKSIANYNVGVTHRRKFSVALDGLSCEELDVVNAVPPEKDGGRVSAYNALTPTVVTLDKKPVQSAADTLILRTHNPATEYDLVQAMTVLSVDGYDVTCTATPTVTPVADQTVWAYGPTAEILSKWRVTKITQRDDSSLGLVHDIETETYYDLEPPDAWDPEISFTYNSYSIGHTYNNVPVISDINKPMPYPGFLPFYDYPVAVNRNITGNGADTVTWAKDDAAEDIEMTYRGVSSTLTAGSTTLKYIYWDPDAPTVYSATDTKATAQAGNNFLIAANESGVLYLYDNQAMSSADLHDVAIDYNSDNNQDGTAITVPTIAADGTAVDHVINDDGGSDVSFEWAWAGSANDIDGWFVYVRISTSGASYNFGATPAEEHLHVVPASSKRVFFLYGVPANKHITFGVAAYRVVNTNVAASGLITTAIVQPALAAEDPYRPAATVAFAGDVTGTVDGTSASTVKSNAASGATFTSTDASILVNSHRADENCDATHPLVIDWKVPANTVSITEVLLSVKIKLYRTDSTAAASGGSDTSGSGGQQTSSGGGTGYLDETDGMTLGSDKTTGAASTSNSGSTNLGSPAGYVDYAEAYTASVVSSEDGTGTHNHDMPSKPNFSGHRHAIDSSNHNHTITHTHEITDHDHLITLSDHTHDVVDHTHSTPAHTHGITYGIYEEDNAPITITYQVDNGAGYGAASASFTTDQTDIDITAAITTNGWKAIKFNVDKRARLTGIIEFKGSVV